MSMDLYLAPSGFREWRDHELDAFFDAQPTPENVELGRYLYVAFALEAISHNLEDDAPGSKFPLVQRIHTDEHEIVGWYHDEIPPLLNEIETIRSRLMKLPVNRST